MRNGNLIFLTPEGSPSDRRRLSAFCTAQGTHQAEDDDSALPNKYAKDVYWWGDADFMPASMEAEFCALVKQDERNPMLERIADGLLPAVEAVGLEYLALNRRGRSWGDNRLFLPVIVTNADLYTATCKLSDISMATGELTVDTCSFARVPFIRFRKSLSTHVPSHLTHAIRNRQGATLEDASKGNERTILVINSLAISDTLKQLKIPEQFGPMFGQRFSRIAEDLREIKGS